LKSPKKSCPAGNERPFLREQLGRFTTEPFLRGLSRKTRRTRHKRERERGLLKERKVLKKEENERERTGTIYYRS
jgi:hypothetical protein